ncbi:MAG: threonine/serine exporter family protein [Clostridium sp.]|uniref:threonine/serine exporter family protein n=1 Tax=Clostridium sp. TaxID=1506 RepID=UPI001EBA34E3|nr:threonine/serine exporter family protein [Clostridium sp.]MBS5883298.1 threonine/serine exporter family protein [Clostridium sp.]MDU7146925.1 threonine/serine exporter family protein [Clostridium sp.]MDU7240021.1 threonine/serine exporter family protein [Clostridium sp.]
MEINNILQVAAYAGKIMLESGAEAYRVEETMNRICNSLGIEVANSYATPTVIIASASYQGEIKSLVVRISSRSVDLQRIHKVNDLARNIVKNKLTVEELNDNLKEIEEERRYSNTITIFFSAVGAFGFVFLFGGSLRDAIAAFLIGIVVKYFSIKGEKIGLNSFFNTSICAGILAFLAIISIKIGLAFDMDKVIIGSIMLLVPGLAITNAIRDTVAGDLVSGLARGAEAFLTAIAVAVGTGVVLSFWIGSFGGI